MFLPAIDENEVEVLNFTDSYSKPYMIKQSAGLGNEYLWVGDMHLTHSQVLAIHNALAYWLATGHLFPETLG
jgi:hypothetical protein